MSRKRKDIPDLQEALDKRWCYYCERIFQDDKVLCDHQRYKHFRCDWDQQYSCGKKFTTAGGLSVHMTQVHKSKLEKIQNTIEGRENPSVEIFGMLGIPQELLDAHRRDIETQYYQAEAEHRAKTGNPLRGPNPNAGTRQIEELTHEEKMAKLEAHRAKNRANKAAREAGYKDAEDQVRQLAAKDGTQTVAGAEGVETFTTMQSPVSGFQSQPQYISSAISPLGINPQFAPPPYHPNGSVSPAPGFYNPGYMVTNPQHNTAFTNPLYGTFGYGMPPPITGFNAPSQDLSAFQVPVSLPMPLPMPLPKPPRTVSEPQPVTSPLPAPTSGLPARPAFNSIPNITREEMAQLHGANQPLPSLNAHSKRTPQVLASSNGHTTNNKEFDASLTDMINQEAQKAQHRDSVAQTPFVPVRVIDDPIIITASKTPPKQTKNKTENQVFKIQNHLVLPEELRAADRKFVSTFTLKPSAKNVNDAKSVPWYTAMFQAMRDAGRI